MTLSFPHFLQQVSMIILATVLVVIPLYYLTIIINHSNPMNYLDKQNSLSFQNITQTMKIKRSKKQGLCYYHNDKMAKYRDRSSELLYCTSCAIQEASKGALIQDFVKRGQGSQFSSLLTEVYEECQAEIHEYIRIYNASYQRLIETLTDIQIKDLLAFNKKIEENHITYQQLKGQLQIQGKRQEIKSYFTSDQHKAIITKLNQLNRTMTNLKQQSCRSSELSIRLSPKIPAKYKSDYSLSKQLNISNTSLHQKSMASRQGSWKSFNISNKDTNSLKSKNNSTVEQVKKSVYEDTPESIKLRLSQNSFKVTNQMAVTMFEKIDVCQSIDISQQSSNQPFEHHSGQNGEARASFSSLKSRNRYNKDL